MYAKHPAKPVQLPMRTGLKIYYLLAAFQQLVSAGIRAQNETAMDRWIEVYVQTISPLLPVAVLPKISSHRNHQTQLYMTLWAVYLLVANAVTHAIRATSLHSKVQNNVICANLRVTARNSHARIDKTMETYAP
jgi:hypothetical protein